MLATRIIPCLDIDDGKVVKGIKFKGIQEAGDPFELAKFYNDQGADEIIFLDIGASYKSRDILMNVLEKVSRNVFIPLTVGGGIRKTEDMRKVLHAGADKIAMCTSAIENPNLISDGAKIFGSQCIVISIDAKREGNNWHAYTHGGRKDSGLDVIEWAKKCENLGAGEILLNSIDMDGTKSGYDLELTKTISETVHIPVIASGGAGNLEQIYDAILFGKADAVLIASLLHFGEYTVHDIKQFLQDKEVIVRW
jgi:cyclase